MRFQRLASSDSGVGLRTSEVEEEGAGGLDGLLVGAGDGKTIESGPGPELTDGATGVVDSSAADAWRASRHRLDRIASTFFIPPRNTLI